MTTDFGIIQFSKINQPDILSGYTLDDNARALIATCMHYELTGDEADAEEDEEVREITRYQVLLNQLHVKINGEEPVDGE